ncbi:glycine--tRNA ligase [Candidatus Gottesmanbacteria bacterium]|nr:glycine--tRNA ligase [Candidatus Gottesmanbacteria bacterium]
MEKIVSLCKRRGFIFPSSEIYGGLQGFWDAGPLGVELKKNIKNLWWKTMVYDREDVVGLDSTIIHHPKVWQASGHAISFTDPLRECKKCHLRFRADKIETQNCPECGGTFAGVKQFNLMFRTHVGPAEETASLAYLRPETCQGIFINFGNVIDAFHPKLPFGIAQIGKGFRNEITTGDFIFRDREFEMMELEYFVKPGEDEKWYDYWLKERMKWYLALGLKKENLRLFEHSKESLAHYSKRTVDIEYKFPFGFAELEGIANRTDFDLKNHSKFSGKELKYKEENGEEYYPYVIEPSVGVERLMLALLVDGYSEEGERLVLKLNPQLAPIKVAVFPLLANKPELIKVARKIYEDLRPHFICAFDDRGNIGKRYYAQDEIGTPWCVTFDFDTLEEETVTVRDRDTTRQERIKIDKLKEYFERKLI